jgi:hypothetical protein
MACNGYGHSSNCDCGWGGVFYDPASIKYSIDYWNKEKSYSNPNAHCPVCKADVFFYRSPDGGAVFFDHPGPPWPKHPCTDPENINRTKPPSTAEKMKGWWPFLCKELYPLPNNEGTILYTTEDRVIFVKGKIKLGAPIWIRKSVGSTEGEYEISSLRSKKGKTYGVSHKAFSVDDLAKTSIAEHFQHTIEILNKSLRENSS